MLRSPLMRELALMVCALLLGGAGTTAARAQGRADGVVVTQDDNKKRFNIRVGDELKIRLYQSKTGSDWRLTPGSDAVLKLLSVQNVSDHPQGKPALQTRLFKFQAIAAGTVRVTCLYDQFSGSQWQGTLTWWVDVNAY